MFLGGVGRLLRALGGGTTFSPVSLFANGEPGGWYDPSDLTTMFQDAAGTTAAALEQPVGLVLDKSKGLVLGSELVTNGGFDSATGWSLGANSSITGGQLIMTAPAANETVSPAPSNILIVNSFHFVQIDVASITGSANVFLGNTSLSLSAGIRTFRAQCTANANLLIRVSTGGSLTLNSISVRELPGNHLSQSTAAARPVLSARVNALTYTEDFSNAAWVKSGLLAFGSGSTANAAVAPNGTTTADLITESTATSRHEVQQAASPVLSGSTAYVFSFYAKEPPANSRRYVQTFSNGTDGTWHANFDLNAGVVSGIGSNGTASITSVGDGWFRCVWNFTSAASPAGSVVYISLLNSGTAARAASYTGDGTSGIYIWGADLRPANAGVGLPAYQWVGAATDYDTTGFPLYLKFDGTDDFLVSGTITPGADKAQVFAGVRKLSDAAVGVVAEFSTTVSASNGAFLAVAPDSARPSYAFATKGTTVRYAEVISGYPAPDTRVFTGLGDISGDLSTLRLNGTQVAQTTGDQGTGDYLAYPLYVGRRGGTSLPFNGHLYSLILRFSATNLPDATIAQTETWVNGKTYAYGPPVPSTANNLIWATGNNLIWGSGNNIAWGTS